MEMLDFVIRLGAAVLAGILIGVEREWRLRSAGLLTNTLVAVGACVYVMASDILSNGSTLTDPSRVLGQIVAGIGFLGAGVIMRDGVNIHGLNSAATIWCSAAVGSLTGFHLIVEAFIVAGVIASLNLSIRPIASYINKKSIKKNYYRNGRIIKLYFSEKDEAGLRIKLMEILQNYPTLRLKSFQVLQTTAFLYATELSCEIIYASNAVSDFEQFVYEASKIPNLIKIQQDCIVANN
ncbi:MAG: MgtC/SapB family protein [Bacteroidales bacterium]|jgi:putative Mg2+ transporter-C (MgtC) family protein|nr:MgtC/SapB family protein [Bacteroidales bacterium]